MAAGGASVAMIAMVVLAAVIGVGWIVPMVVGIVLLRRQSRVAGTVCTVIASLWLLGAVAAFVLFAVVVPRASRKHYQPPPPFDAKAYTGEMGEFVLTHKGESKFQAVGGTPARTMQFTTANGVVRAPVGSWQVMSYEARMPDAKGDIWVARGNPAAKMYKLDVKKQSPEPVQLGLPFKAEAKISTTGQDMANLDFSLVGVDGYRYTINREKGSTPPPSFEVVSKTGEVVWKGNFEFG